MPPEKTPSPLRPILPPLLRFLYGRWGRVVMSGVKAGCILACPIIIVVLRLLRMSVQSLPTSRQASVELQMKLFQTWSKFQVDPAYQNLLMLYLTHLQPPALDLQIQTEIAATLQLTSPHHQLQRLRRQRRSIATQLTQVASASTPQLAKACTLLDELRSVNLSSAQLILSMRERFAPEEKTDSQAQLPIYWEWLAELDAERELLRQSYLGEHIRFSPDYDPFLLHHYEYTHTQKLAGEESQSEPVRKLFGISIHHAYRLLRTRNAIMDIRATAHSPTPHRLALPNNNKPYLDATYHLPPNTTKHPLPKYQEPPLLYSRALEEPDEFSSHRTLPKEPTPIRIQPITVNPTPTPVRSFYFQRPESSSVTEIPPNKLKFSRIGKPLRTESDVGYEFMRGQPSRQELAVPAEYEESRSYNTGKSIDIPRRTVTEWALPGKTEKYRTEVNDTIKPLKLAPINVVPQKRSATQQEVLPPKQMSPAARVQPQKEKEPSPKVSSVTERPRQYQPELENIKNYNPVKRQIYQRTVEKPEKARYDYNLDPIQEDSQPQPQGRVPGKLKQYIKSSKPSEKSEKSEKQEKTEDDGLSSQMPIEKYLLRTRYPKAVSQSKAAAKKQTEKEKKIEKKETNSEVSLPKIKKSAPKIDQQCQTLQLKTPKKQETPRKDEKKKANQEMQTDKINSPKPPPAKQPPPKPQTEQEEESEDEQSSQEPTKPPPKKKGAGQQSDATIEEEDFIDERPKKKPEPKNSVPLIRTIDKKQAKKDSNKNIPPTKPKAESQQPIARQTSQKTDPNSAKAQSNSNSQMQIKIKVGKATVSELQSMLAQSNINPKYKALFEMEKLQQWIKVSQTYLLQFQVNDQTAVISLCSPIPNIGIALKLWAPILPLADDALSLKLFKRYIASIEKDSTDTKIMYSGGEFPQLLSAEFVMKKEKLYEKIKGQPPKESSRQFEQFLQLSCSNIKFSQSGDASLLYSTEIDQFSDSNHYCPSFIKATTEKVPDNLQSLFRFSQEIPGFKQLNKLLEKQGLDTYEGSNVQAKSISLLRMTLVTSFKATFIAQDGYFKFAGTLVHEKDKECIVLIPMAKANGNLIFAKGLAIDKLVDLISKKPAGTKANFTVPMFSKKIYGKMPKTKDGCYGNWEINLNWEDEIKGRVKHPMNEGKSFGNEPFWVAVQIQKQLLYCTEINKDDHTF